MTKGVLLTLDNERCRMELGPPAAPAPTPPSKRRPLGADVDHNARCASRSPAGGKHKVARVVPSGGFDLLALASTVTSSVLEALDDVAASIENPAAPYEDYKPDSSYDEFVPGGRPAVGSAHKRRSVSVPRNAESAGRNRPAARGRRTATREPSPPPPLLSLFSGVGASLASTFSALPFAFGSGVELVDSWLDATLDSVLGPPTVTPNSTPRKGSGGNEHAAAPWTFRSAKLSILGEEAKARMRVLSAEPWLLSEDTVRFLIIVLLTSPDLQHEGVRA
ncbi:hypothetical protein T492DRAFT_84739 [Pavlovales sp. CCMP2436]|nr:hypothetical protein T492DRAFT_84739 [Pavlovales sp. CCMP2436]